MMSTVTPRDSTKNRNLSGKGEPAMMATVNPQTRSGKQAQQGHLTGCCKPCRFFHKEEGCRWGSQCKFCHRCGPHEKALRERSERWISKLQNRVDTELVQEILDALESQVSSKESGLVVSLYSSDLCVARVRPSDK